MFGKSLNLCSVGEVGAYDLSLTLLLAPSLKILKLKLSPYGGGDRSKFFCSAINFGHYVFMVFGRFRGQTLPRDGRLSVSSETVTTRKRGVHVILFLRNYF